MTEQPEASNTAIPAHKGQVCHKVYVSVGPPVPDPMGGMSSKLLLTCCCGWERQYGYNGTLEEINAIVKNEHDLKERDWNSPDDPSSDEHEKAFYAEVAKTFPPANK